MDPISGTAGQASGGPPNTLAAVAALWARFKPDAAARADVLGRAIESLCDGQLDEAQRQEAERTAHALAGALGTFGFPEGSAIARQLEEGFQNQPSCDQAADLAERLQWLRQSIECPLPTPNAVARVDALPLLLIIDRDRALIDRMLAEAGRRGIRAAGAHSLAEAQAAIGRDRPDVVLLDLTHEDDHEAGLQLLEAQTGQGVPVYVQTERHVFLDRVEVAKRGGRGFLQKPLPPAQAIDVIEQHLKSLQDAEARVLAVDDDPHVLALIKAYLEPRGLRVTTLSEPLRFWDVLEELGPDLVVLDVEMPQLSGFDLCRVVRNDARWGGEEFVVGMFGMNRHDAVQRLAEVLEAMRQESFKSTAGSSFRVTFSGGVAELGTDGSDLGALYRAADKALYRAKECGRDRVLPVGWQPPGDDQDAIDIALVDDDESIAALLLSAFETRGYRAVWLQDGFEAAEQLPRLRPRVTVLDFSLPGLNGLSLLKRMADSGLLRESRAIMLTARSAETDVRLAKELGAFDYVSKPFNVGALIQRIRRAMAEELEPAID